MKRVEKVIAREKRARERERERASARDCSEISPKQAGRAQTADLPQRTYVEFAFGVTSTLQA